MKRNPTICDATVPVALGATSQLMFIRGKNVRLTKSLYANVYFEIMLVSEFWHLTSTLSSIAWRRTSRFIFFAHTHQKKTGDTQVIATRKYLWCGSYISNGLNFFAYIFCHGITLNKKIRGASLPTYCLGSDIRFLSRSSCYWTILNKHLKQSPWFMALRKNCAGNLFISIIQ